MTIAKIIDGAIGREGRYSNHPSDRGGETMWGITIAVARRNGYTGSMKSMPRATAEAIYRSEYVEKPGFGAIIPLSEPIAEELIDTGINMGIAVPSMFLQRALNALNRQGRDYADLAVDGDCGPATRGALLRFLSMRGKQGEAVMLKALNALQGERYIDIAEKRGANEDFVFGWFANRVS